MITPLKGEQVFYRGPTPGAPLHDHHLLVVINDQGEPIQSACWSDRSLEPCPGALAAFLGLEPQARATLVRTPNPLRTEKIRTMLEGGDLGPLQFHDAGVSPEVAHGGGAQRLRDFQNNVTSAPMALRSPLRAIQLEEPATQNPSSQPETEAEAEQRHEDRVARLHEMGYTGAALQRMIEASEAKLRSDYDAVARRRRNPGRGSALQNFARCCHNPSRDVRAECIFDGMLSSLGNSQGTEYLARCAYNAPSLQNLPIPDTRRVSPDRHENPGIWINPAREDSLPKLREGLLLLDHHIEDLAHAAVTGNTDYANETAADARKIVASLKRLLGADESCALPNPARESSTSDEVAYMPDDSDMVGGSGD